MEIIRTVKDMQEHAATMRLDGRKLALVPTMGALHEGHLKLVEEAKRQGDHTTVSIFVNPTQFGPGEDFNRYPRVEEEDLALLDRDGVEVVFIPSEEEMYPGGQTSARTWVTVEHLDQHLCGRFRPGHFRGVTTVVAKLFLACKPHMAVFGLKDAQQFVILKRMVRDLHFGIDIIGVPTVREADGLAKSSRNSYLEASDRAQAVVLSQAVQEAERLIQAGERRSDVMVETMRQVISQAPAVQIQYAEIVDAHELQPVARIEAGQEILAAAAVFFGKTRLIDNSFTVAPSN